MAEGRCWHCGKPCAPYYECKERRLYKQLTYYLDRMIALGTITKHRPGISVTYAVAHGVQDLSDKSRSSYSHRPDDRRCLPRLNGKPIDVQLLIIEALQAHGALSEKELSAAVARRITKAKNDCRNTTNAQRAPAGQKTASIGTPKK